jgi:class 3 adenylate cyclase/putative methionine-R-sulfoxide reductase with GAF domain
VSHVDVDDDRASTRPVDAERQARAFREVLELLRSTTGDLEEVLTEVGQRAAALCRSVTGFIYLLDGDVMRFTVGWGGRAEMWDYERAHPNAIDRRTVCGRVALERRTVHIPDVLTDPDYDYGEGQQVAGYRTLLGVPIFGSDGFIGLIGLSRTEVDPFTEAEIELVKAFADQASIAIRIAGFVTEREDAIQRETAVREVLQAMGRSGFDLAGTLRTVIEHAVKLARADNGDIQQREGASFRSVVRAVASLEPGPQEIALHREYQADRTTAIGRVLLERRAIHIDDVLADPDYDFPEAQAAYGFRTILGVPLLRDGEVAGVMSVWRRDVRPFSEREIAIVATFAEQALIAIENVDLYTTVQRQREELARFAPQVAGLLSSQEGERLLAGHRREISVLYSDLRGFTAFAETAEPEEVLGVLRQYHEAAGESTVRHGGTVEHFAGDGLMAFFNDPEPVADHPRAAVETAVEMRERFEGLAAGWRRRGYELGLGIGIAVGYASIGRIGFEGRYDYAAVGNAVILAARLSSAAQAGEILLSQRALVEVEDFVEVEDIEGLELKGFSRAVTAYRISALRAAGTKTTAEP